MFLIAVQDLMAEAKRAATATFDFVGTYMVMVFALDTLPKFLDRKTKIPRVELEMRN